MVAGAAIGGGLGYVAGEAVAQRQKQYASTEDFYDAQIKETAQLNQAISMENQRLRTSIQEDQRQIDNLAKRYQSGQASREQLESAMSTINKKRAASEKNLADAKKELEIQQAVLTKAEKEGQGQNQRVGKLRGQVNELNSSINTMQQQVDQYATMSNAVHL